MHGLQLLDRQHNAELLTELSAAQSPSIELLLEVVHGQDSLSADSVVELLAVLDDTAPLTAVSARPVVAFNDLINRFFSLLYLVFCNLVIY